MYCNPWLGIIFTSVFIFCRHVHCLDYTLCDLSHHTNCARSYLECWYVNSIIAILYPLNIHLSSCWVTCGWLYARSCFTSELKNVPILLCVKYLRLKIQVFRKCTSFCYLKVDQYCLPFDQVSGPKCANRISNNLIVPYKKFVTGILQPKITSLFPLTLNRNLVIDKNLILIEF